MKDRILDFFTKFWAKVSSLALFSISMYGMGLKEKSDLITWLTYIFGAGSLAALSAALFTSDHEDLKEKRIADKKLYDRIIDLLPYDNNFSYWLNEFDLSARSFDAQYFQKVLVLSDNLYREKTTFFHDSKLDVSYKAFLNSLFEFASKLSSYTVRKGDRIQGVYRAEEEPPYKRDDENERIWQSRVDELNSKATLLYERYTEFNLLAKKILKL